MEQPTSAILSSTQKVVSLSGAESEHSMVHCASVSRVGQHGTRVGTRGSRANLDRRCSSTRAGPSKPERRHQAHGNPVLLAAAEREKPGAPDRKGQWNRQSRRCDGEATGWKAFDNAGRPIEHEAHQWTAQLSTKSSRLTEYIARVSRTLAVMTLVRQGAANGVAVPSRSESVKWINEAELDERWMDGQSLLFVFWCIWCRRGGVVATVSNSAQTPEEGCNLQDIKARIPLVRTGRAASWKSDCLLSC